MEEETRAMQLLATPAKTASPRTAKTPNSLVKRMSRVSLSEKNWSVSKTDGTKLLLKRAILADKSEKDSPKNSTLKKPETPKSTKSLTAKNLYEVLSMELKESSDDELPTLIIRQQTPTTPKRKQSLTKSYDVTPKKVLNFDDDDEEKTYATRSGRVTKNPVNYNEGELSPIKRTPRRTRRTTESDDDFKPAPKTPKTPRTPRTPKTGTPQTPKRSVGRKVMSQLTPSLRNRAHSVENIEGTLNTK